MDVVFIMMTYLPIRTLSRLRHVNRRYNRLVTAFLTGEIHGFLSHFVSDPLAFRGEMAASSAVIDGPFPLSLLLRHTQFDYENPPTLRICLPAMGSDSRFVDFLLAEGYSLVNIASTHPTVQGGVAVISIFCNKSTGRHIHVLYSRAGAAELPAALQCFTAKMNIITHSRIHFAYADLALDGKTFVNPERLTEPWLMMDWANMLERGWEVVEVETSGLPRPPGWSWRQGPWHPHNRLRSFDDAQSLSFELEPHGGQFVREGDDRVQWAMGGRHMGVAVVW